jgi:uncharacterized protein (DUF983 family)
MICPYCGEDRLIDLKELGLKCDACGIEIRRGNYKK